MYFLSRFFRRRCIRRVCICASGCYLKVRLPCGHKTFKLSLTEIWSQPEGKSVRPNKECNHAHKTHTHTRAHKKGGGAKNASGWTEEMSWGTGNVLVKTYLHEVGAQSQPPCVLDCSCIFSWFGLAVFKDTLENSNLQVHPVHFQFLHDLIDIPSLFTSCFLLFYLINDLSLEYDSNIACQISDKLVHMYRPRHLTV